MTSAPFDNDAAAGTALFVRVSDSRFRNMNKLNIFKGTDEESKKRVRETSTQP